MNKKVIGVVVVLVILINALGGLEPNIKRINCKFHPFEKIDVIEKDEILPQYGVSIDFSSGITSHRVIKRLLPGEAKSLSKTVYKLDKDGKMNAIFLIAFIRNQTGNGEYPFRFGGCSNQEESVNNFVKNVYKRCELDYTYSIDSIGEALIRNPEFSEVIAHTMDDVARKWYEGCIMK